MKPCPFCNYTPGPLLLARNNASKSVVCNHCGAQGPMADDEKAAVAAWDRAAIPVNEGKAGDDGGKGCRAEQRGPDQWSCDCFHMRPDCKPNLAPGVAALDNQTLSSSSTGGVESE